MRLSDKVIDASVNVSRLVELGQHQPAWAERCSSGVGSGW